jgi:hypothetical protein
VIPAVCPKKHWLKNIVSPPSDEPNDHDVAVLGVEVDNVSVHLETFWIVRPVKRQVTKLLVHSGIASAVYGTEVSPSLSAADIVTLHVMGNMPNENEARVDPPAVPSLVAVMSQVVPVTHVIEADAGATQITHASTKTSAPVANRNIE